MHVLIILMKEIILPSLSNCKFVLSAKIDVAKKSLFSSNGFKESIADEIFSILSCEHDSILMNY